MVLLSLIILAGFCFNFQFHPLYILFPGTCSWLQFLRKLYFIYLLINIYHTSFYKGFKVVCMSSNPESR